jgi:LPXTG-motif cell wall-anchored protein
MQRIALLVVAGTDGAYIEFVGWNTEPDGTGTRYLAGMTPTLPEGTVLYAEWKPLSAGLPNTGLEVAQILPLALGLLAAGAILTTRRLKFKKRSA